jgi:hypothetical protein
MKRGYHHLLCTFFLVSLLRPWATVVAQIPMECAVITSTGPVVSLKGAPGNPYLLCNAIQNIRVNIHFLQHDNGNGSTTAWDDGRPGNPGAALTGYDYAQSLIWACNGQMDQNPPLRLAPAIRLPRYPNGCIGCGRRFFDCSTVYRNGSGAGPAPQTHDYGPLCVRADPLINIFLVEETPWPYVGLVGASTLTRPPRPFSWQACWPRRNSGYSICRAAWCALWAQPELPHQP